MKTKKTTTSREVLSWGLSFIIPFILVMLLRMFIFGSYWIPSASMSPTLQVGDRIITLTFWPADPAKGDIIVFSDEQGWGTETDFGPQENFVKRVIATEGETIYAEDGVVYVNDSPISEPYVVGITSDFEEQTVPEDAVFVMGDNREFSADSRAHIHSGTQFISLESIQGKYLITYWPLGDR